MTRAVGDEDSMLKSLREVVELFEHAQISVFKLMSSVSQQASFFSILTFSRTRCPSSCETRNMPTCCGSMRLSSVSMAEPTHHNLLQSDHQVSQRDASDFMPLMLATLDTVQSVMLTRAESSDTSHGIDPEYSQAYLALSGS